MKAVYVCIFMVAATFVGNAAAETGFTYHTTLYSCTFKDGDGGGDKNSEIKLGDQIGQACVDGCIERKKIDDTINGVTIYADMSPGCWCERNMSSRWSAWYHLKIYNYKTCYLSSYKPVNGGFSAWSAFSTCSKNCGGGEKSRTRSCDNPKPAHGGKNCVGSEVEKLTCNNDPCPVNGGYSAWASFSRCSRTCGVSGIQVRKRYCTNPSPAYGGKTCVGQSTERRHCNVHKCPKICRSETGYCLKSSGRDQNSGVVKLNSIDGSSISAQRECLNLCLAYRGATGCEAIWNRINRGCYVHTREVARGSGRGRHTCWVFSKCH